MTGDTEKGIALMQEAIRLSPYHPDWYLSDLWTGYFVAGRYEEALDTLLKISNPYPAVYRRLAATYPYLDRIEEARAAMAKYRELEPQASVEHFAQTEPMKRPEDLERFLDGLRKAGLPEKAPAPGT